MKKELQQRLDRAIQNKVELIKINNKLKRNKPKNLDDITHEAHLSAFKKINCLECANCCKTTSPAIYERDIDRLSKQLKMKPSAFITAYLKKDEVGDYVLQKTPCPFLDAENYCMVYESRPTACKEYPHTDRKRFYQILDLSLKNTEICPAVADVFDVLNKTYG